MSFTDEMALSLAAVEQVHGCVQRLPDDHVLAELVLTGCVTDSRAYMCAHCWMVITIEPDGELSQWVASFEPDSEPDFGDSLP